MGELLKDKVAMVTGASRGIGEATALTLAQAGADVIVTARNGDELAALAERLERMGVAALHLHATDHCPAPGGRGVDRPPDPRLRPDSARRPAG